MRGVKEKFELAIAHKSQGELRFAEFARDVASYVQAKRVTID